MDCVREKIPTFNNKRMRVKERKAAMEITTSFGNYDVEIVIDRYRADDSLYVGLVEKETGEPFTDVTVCFNDQLLSASFAAELEIDSTGIAYCYIDMNNLPEIKDFIEKYELGKPTQIKKHAGYCDYPLYKMDLTKLREIAKNNYYDKEN